MDSSCSRRITDDSKELHMFQKDYRCLRRIAYARKETLDGKTRNDYNIIYQKALLVLIGVSHTRHHVNLSPEEKEYETWQK